MTKNVFQTALAAFLEAENVIYGPLSVEESKARARLIYGCIRLLDELDISSESEVPAALADIEGMSNEV